MPKMIAPVTIALRTGLFAFIILGLVTMVFNASKDKIAHNEQLALLQQLQAVIPQDMYDNDLSKDVIRLQSYTIYRARKKGQPVAAVLKTTTPHGYNGDISLLVAIDVSGKILGVRVISHHETPGLGDRIELEKSAWVLSFAQKSLTNETLALWAVKRDGGMFDQFTGATITPRAIVNAVKNAGIFFLQQQQNIFQ